MSRFLVYGLANGWGGVEAIVMSMVQRMEKQHQFDIVIGKGECQYEMRYASDNVSFLHFPSWGGERKAFVKSIEIQLRSKDYDFVWVNGCIMSNKDILAATRRASKAKIITHSHGSSFEEDNRLKRYVLLGLHYLHRGYYRKTVDVPCMCSYRSGIWYYGGKYMLHHNVHLINNGIDMTRFAFDQAIRDEYRKSLGLSGEIALFHAGRLTQVKNQKYLLEILKSLHGSGRKYKLFIAGEGELESELKSYSRELGVENDVVFLGKRDDVDKLYQAMDIFLLPSHHEGFPVTLAEAQASGLFCIVSNNVSSETNLTGQIDYIDIKNDNLTDWANAIVSYDASNISRTEMCKVVKYRGFDINKVCEAFEHHLKI